MDVSGSSEGGAGLGRVRSSIESLLVVSIASSAVIEYSGFVIASSAMVERVSPVESKM